jgi:hypothetical protein
METESNQNVLNGPPLNPIQSQNNPIHTLLVTFTLQACTIIVKSMKPYAGVEVTLHLFLT